MEIYLASKSPRRKQLLEQMEVPFEILSVDIPEVVQPGELPDEYSQRITREKLENAWQTLKEQSMPLRPILCADTEVIFNNTILGKPASEQEAYQTLKQYSDTTHTVITSVGIIHNNHIDVRLNRTEVTFAPIPDEAIRHYLSTDHYLDKAGSYGIQSYIGQYISGIEGCFYSVMGLPLNTVRQLLDSLS